MFTKKLLTGLALITTLKLFCSVITLRELQELEPATRTAQTVNHSTQAVKPISYWPINLFSSAYSSFYDFLFPNFDKLIERGSDIKVPVSSKSLAGLHHASTLLVSCIDFRLRDETDKLMEKVFRLTDEYDEVALPGAAIALVPPSKKYKHWKKTLTDIVNLAHDLHGIERVIFLDHRGCGAYKLMLGEASVNTAEKETQAHKKVFEQARKVFDEKFPHIKMYTLLMGLDGTVEIFK
ncbi:MAG: hypothetical protein NT128_02105 [Proteobacteria bacterium]|nr:hypothetical protein [Pseudomonadota bacterium]